jgi:succinate dehydrogenase hydrophobic anchor subunit
VQGEILSATPQKENSLSQQTWKHLLAREWIYLCGIVLVTLLAWSVFFTIFWPEQVGNYFRALGGGREAQQAWLLTLAPYLLVQFVRSLLWCRKTLKKSK